jgi:hypothetical protein
LLHFIVLLQVWNVVISNESNNLQVAVYCQVKYCSTLDKKWWTLCWQKINVFLVDKFSGYYRIYLACCTKPIINTYLNQTLVYKWHTNIKTGWTPGRRKGPSCPLFYFQNLLEKIINKISLYFLFYFLWHYHFFIFRNSADCIQPKK